MCALLGVTRQGYYAYAARPPSARFISDRDLCERIRALHAESNGTYGSPRIYEALRQEGRNVSKTRVERTMRGLGLCGCAPHRSRQTTRANPKHPVVGNRLDRDFTAERPDQRWVTDISYVWTNEGWCYLAVVLDLFSRAVVGWSLDTTLTTRLPLNALNAALETRRPAAGLLHHSDRGCQYTSDDYRRELKKHGIEASMSRRGNCWDNAVAESFFATLKTELIYRRNWSLRVELREAVFEYIEVFYNRSRRHSTLGYSSPTQFLQDWLSKHADRQSRAA